jgi:transcriptional regulator with XRE-family HTH domain
MQVEGSLRKWRLLRNFKQAYLAQALGMSQQNYHKIETGKTKLEVGVAERLALLLEVKLEEIYTSPALAPPPDTKRSLRSTNACCKKKSNASMRCANCSILCWAKSPPSTIKRSRAGHQKQ